MNIFTGKKILLLFILVLFNISVVFGQEMENNSISVGLILFRKNYHEYSLPAFPGLNIEYERSLSQKISLSVEIGTLLILPYIEIGVRFYPWSGSFFTGLSLGSFLLGSAGETLTISPEFGWRTGIGISNKWFLSNSVGIKIMNIIFNDGFIDAFFPKINLMIGYKF